LNLACEHLAQALCGAANFQQQVVADRLVRAWPRA